MSMPRYLEGDQPETIPVAAHAASEINDEPPARPQHSATGIVWAVLASLCVLFVLAVSLLAARSGA